MISRIRSATPPSCLTFSFLTKGRTVVDAAVEDTVVISGITVSGDDLTGGTGLHEIEEVDSSASSTLTSRTLLLPTDAFANSPVAVSPIHRSGDVEGTFSHTVTSDSAEVRKNVSASYVRTGLEGLHKMLAVRSHIAMSHCGQRSTHSGHLVLP